MKPVTVLIIRKHDSVCVMKAHERNALLVHFIY